MKTILPICVLIINIRKCLLDCIDEYGNSITENIMPELIDYRGYPRIDFDSFHSSTVTCDSLSSLQKRDANEVSIQNLSITLNMPFIWPHENYDVPFEITRLLIENVGLETISEHGFQGLDVTNTLNLSRNKLSNIMEYYFNTLSNIQVLDLSYNEIRFVDPEAFHQNSKLDTLHLNNNNLKTLGELTFSESMALKTLHISENPITYLDMSLIKNTPDLELLKANNLQLKNEPINSKDSLKEIFISENKITEINDHFCNDLSNLIVLDLSRNAIRTVDDTCFSKMTALEKLNISHNNISYNMMTEHMSNTRLKYFDISYNNLQNTTISFSRNQSQLEELYMDATNINLDGAIFFEISRTFTVLSLSGNNLSQVHSKMLKNLMLLKYLNLNYNNILHISQDAIKDLLSLTVLKLRGNKLKTISSHLLRSSSLKQLDLSQNNLTEFAMGTFDRCHNLISMNLSHNHIKSITRYNVFLLRFLEAIYLHDNDLVSVNGIGNLVALKTISLDNNNWNCNYLFRTLDMLQARNVIIIAGSSTHSFQHIKGISCSDNKEDIIETEVIESPTQQLKGRQWLTDNFNNAFPVHKCDTNLNQPISYVIMGIGICILLVASANVYLQISRINKRRFMNENIINMSI